MEILLRNSKGNEFIVKKIKYGYIKNQITTFVEGYYLPRVAFTRKQVKLYKSKSNRPFIVVDKSKLYTVNIEDEKLFADVIDKCEYEMK